MSRGFVVQQPARLDWVVYLRGIAALWVYAYHIWLAMGGITVRFGLSTDFSFGLRSLFRAGYQGVDLFFVLSGFVIAWPYVVRGHTRLGRYEVVDFYQRRYLRIAPVFYFTLVVAIGLIAAGQLRGQLDAGMIASHFLFAENFFPTWIAGIRGVYWTLPTEIHFYLLFPLLLRFTDIDRPLRLALGLLVFAIGYHGLVAWLTTSHGIFVAWTSGLLPGRIDQFGYGVAAACAVSMARHNAIEIRKTTVTLMGMFAVGCLVLVSKNASEQYDFWYLAGTSVSGAAIALFVWCVGVWAQNQEPAMQRSVKGLAKRMLYVLGEASLSIYLWHTFFIDLVLGANYRWHFEGGAKALLLCATVPITLMVSFMTYHLIEAPIIAMSKSTAWRQKLGVLSIA